MKAKIDILLAAYNGEKYIKAQMDSIFLQTFQDFHLYIRDDGSTDGTLKIIQDAININTEKITLLENTKHLGAIQSFSELLNVSKAPYAMFADQDDIWLKDKVKCASDKMQEMENVFGKHKPLLVHGDLKVVDKDLTEISSSYWKYSGLKPREGSYLNRMIVQNEITGCTIMINRPLINLAKPIFPGSVMHDWWIGLTAAAFGHIGYIKEPLILYRQHGNNTLGAKKFGLAMLRDRTPIQEKKWTQANEFLQRYENKLSKENSQMIIDYISMKESSFLRNKYLMFKHRLFKHGLLRNLYSLIFEKQI